MKVFQAWIVSLTGFNFVLTLMGATPWLKADTQIMEIDEVVSHALANSSHIESLIQERQADQLKLEGAGLLPNPFWNIQSGSMESGGSTGLILETQINQLLPFPGKLSVLKRIAETQVSLSSLSALELKLLIQHQVKLTAFQAAVFQEISKHSLERKRRFELIRSYLKTHPQASPSQQVESTLLDIQMRFLEKGILELEQKKLNSQLELQFLTRNPRLVEPQVKWLTKPVHFDDTSLKSMVEALSDHQFDVKRQNIEVRKAAANLEKSQLDKYPDLLLGAAYRLENVQPQNHFYWGSLTLSLPLYDHGQYSVPAARSKLQSEETKLELTRRRAQLLAEQAKSEVENMGKILSAFPLALLQQMESRFEHAEVEFKKGRLSTSLFLQADLQIHETVDSVYESQVLYLQKLSRFLLLVGQPLNWN